MNNQNSDLSEAIRILMLAEEQVKETSEAKQIREITPIDKWLDNEYYIGPDGVRIYDFWKEEMIDIFQGGQKYNEVILECALGVGKTTIATYMLIRKLYEMSCYQNVAALYGLMGTAHTFLMYLSPSLRQAELTGFGQLKTALDSIPYFKKEFQRDPKVSSILKYPEKIVITAGSSEGHQVGSNLIASILDESNFFSGGKISSPDALSQVAHLHNSIVTRGKTRFMRAGVNNSLSILISSPTYKSSYTQDRITRSIGDPTVKVVHGKLWTIKGRELYSPKTFPVFLGNDRMDPLLIRTTEDVNGILSSQGEDELPPDTSLEEALHRLPPEVESRIDNVPIDFKKQYETALIQSIQDISGISVNPVGRLFSSRAILSQAVDKTLRGWFTKTEFIISTLDDSDTNNITHYLIKDVPYQYLKPTHIHIDQSVTTDRTGIAGAHKEGTLLKDGQPLPMVIVDFALRIEPPEPPKQISITRVRSFVLYLAKTVRLRMGKISYDQYQSTESRQVLQENGLDGEYQSVDRTDDQYLNFINMLQDGRVKFSKQVHDLIASEIFDLIHFRERKKVDHPDGGRKDVMDAVVGAVWNAVNDEASSLREKAESDSKVVAEVNREEPVNEERVITTTQLLYGYDPRR